MRRCDLGKARLFLKEEADRRAETAAFLASLDRLDIARERAKRLGREVVQQLNGRKLLLTSPDDAPGVVYHSLKRLNEALAELEAAAACTDVKAEKKQAPIETGDAATTGEKRKVDNAERFDEEVPASVTEPENTVADAELDGVTDEIAVGVICEWITTSHLQERNASFVASISISALMQEVRSRGKRVDVKAIRKVAVFLQAVADAFDGPPSDPSGGSKPEGEETGTENTEAPAETVPSNETVTEAKVDAGTIETSPIDRSLDIPDPLIQAARQRHPVASAPQDTLVPLAPPSPPPPPSAPTPPATPRARSKYYAGNEDDPGWRQLGINTLEVRICSAHDYCERFPRAYNKERVREHIEEMRDRLEVLRKADRAAARVVAAGSAVVS